MSEVKKPRDDYEFYLCVKDKYEVTPDGNVIATTRSGKRIMKKTKEKRYESVTLYLNGVKKKFLVHRLMAFAFFGRPKTGAWVLHNNDNGFDNRIENIRYGTTKENVQDAMNNKVFIVGSKSHLSKLNEQSVSQILHLYNSKQMTQAELAKKFGITHGGIWRIVTKKTWKHLHIKELGVEV